jgi:hypothetical protein
MVQESPQVAAIFRKPGAMKWPDAISLNIEHNPCCDPSKASSCWSEDLQQAERKCWHPAIKMFSAGGHFLWHLCLLQPHYSATSGWAQMRGQWYNLLVVRPLGATEIPIAATCYQPLSSF